MEIAQHYFDRVHLFTNALNDRILEFIPRDNDSIVYNFKFSKNITSDKLLLEKPGKRGLEVQINDEANPEEIVEELVRITAIDKKRIVAIFTLDCTANIFKNRENLIEKYSYVWNACIRHNINLHQDHKLPLCFLYKSGIPRMYETQSICNIRCAGLIDASYNLKHCNQYQDILVNMFNEGNIIPYVVFCNFIKQGHYKKQYTALEKICGMCTLYDSQCNGGCFISKDNISKKDILQRTAFPTL